MLANYRELAMMLVFIKMVDMCNLWVIDLCASTWDNVSKINVRGRILQHYHKSFFPPHIDAAIGTATDILPMDMHYHDDMRYVLLNSYLLRMPY